MSSFSIAAPKLWFGMHGHGSFLSVSQCEGDCDCACPISMNVNDKWALVKTFAQQLSTGKIQSIRLNRDTYLDRTSEHLVALNAEDDRIVVLDDQASRLLSYLPGTQKELREWLPEWSSEVFGQTTALLLAFNVLSSPQAQRTNVVPEASETLVAWFHLTNQCNLSCKYCYVTPGNQRMALSTAQRAVEAVFRSALAHGYTSVKLKYAGGEPTLNFGSLRAAQKQAETLSAQTGIDLGTVLLTNGVHITDDQMDTLLAHNIRIAVSLDGVGRYQDGQRPLADHSGSSFELVTHTLERLLARGISPHISITITKQSLAGLPELVEYLLDRELRFSFNFYREPDHSSEQSALAFTPDEMIEGLKSAFQVIERRLPEYSLLSNLADRADLQAPHLRTCSVGQDYMAIDCNGNVSKCQMDMGYPLTTIDAYDPLALVRADTNRVQNLVVDQKECWGCIWRYRCAGGCPRSTFQRTRRYDAKSPLCQVYQAILPEVVRLEALRLLKYQEPWDFRIPLN